MTAATAPRAPRSRTRTAVGVTVVTLAVLVIAFFIFANLYTDWLWFDQLGYLEVLTTQWWAAIGMFALGFVGMAVPVAVAVEIAFRSRPVYAKLSSQLDRYQQVLEPLRRLAMWGIPAVLGLFTGVSAATRWQVVAQYFNRTPFGRTDPQFGLDASFYVYELPFYRGLLGYASAVLIIALIASAATCYLYGGVRVAGREVRITRATRIQLAVIAALYLLVQAVSLYLDQFGTLVDSNGIGGASTNVGTGATFADVNAVIPARVILAAIAAVVAILFLITAAVGHWRFPLIGLGLLIVSSLILGALYPAAVQRFTVAPSPQAVERPYIERNIEATRYAYGVDKVVTREYDAVTDATAGALREDAETTASIRIIDPNIVGPTFAQLQQQVQYYEFPKRLDVDRYEVDGKTLDTVLSVREIRRDRSDPQSNSWYNSTFVYTHGYGIVAAYGNERDSRGEPKFLESDIPPKGLLGKYEPRVYFGESSPPYSVVGQKRGGENIEIDYPSGGGEDSSRQTTYTGDGGPKIGGPLDKLAYAVKFQSGDLLLTPDVGDKSQILYDRDPIQRVQKAAPYLTTDNDAYPAVVDGRVVWIVDAYTTSADYPYSQVKQLKDAIADSNIVDPTSPLSSINYIRNSVKATVDAYSGKVTLYRWDATDPVLKTWSKVFPGTLKPKSAMSDELLAHIRYPADLFKVQRDVLGAYHVTDPNAFYRGNDRWEPPVDPTTDKKDQITQPPYYLTMQTPGTDTPAFTLYSTYVPPSANDPTGASKTNDVLRGYLTANSDSGADYGELTLLTIPKGRTVSGPGQVQNDFNTDTTVKSALQLLGGNDTEIVKGNLLTLPVGGGLLYVQPIYLQSSGTTAFPLLRKITVGFGNKVGFADTLDEALDQVFGDDSGASAGDAGAGTGDGGTTTPPATGGGPDSGGSGGTGSGDVSPAVRAALEEYQAALTDRDAAYASGDLVAAAQADQRMRAAIQKAIAAEEGATNATGASSSSGSSG